MRQRPGVLRECLVLGSVPGGEHADWSAYPTPCTRQAARLTRPERSPDGLEWEALSLDVRRDIKEFFVSYRVATAEAGRVPFSLRSDDELLRRTGATHGERAAGRAVLHASAVPLLTVHEGSGTVFASLTLDHSCRY